MANISVRKLDDNILNKLKIQAAHHGVSMEEEVRHILTEGVSSKEGLGDAAIRIFGSLYDDEHLEIPAREIHEPIKF